MTKHANLRPGNRRTAGDDRLKVHLHLVDVHGQTWRVLRFRPGFDARFSTNWFHATWHVLSDRRGALLLSQVFWALAFQRHERTIFLVDGPHLGTEPFDGSRCHPLAITSTRLGVPGPEVLRGIQWQLRKPRRPEGTVRLHTFGLAAGPAEPSPPRWSRAWSEERMERVGGAIRYSAPPDVLRARAREVSRLSPRRYGGSDALFLARQPRGPFYPEGEVQIFHDYRLRVSAAAQAREAVPDDNGEDPLLLFRRWDEMDRIRARMHLARPSAPASRGVTPDPSLPSRPRRDPGA